MSSCHNDGAIAPTTCCAAEEYPYSGSCSCYFQEPWRCTVYSGNSCYCDFWTTYSEYAEYGTSACGAGVDQNGDTWTCCESDTGTCSCSNYMECDSWEHEVNNCASASQLGLTAFSGCGNAEGYEVDDCGGAWGGDGDGDGDCDDDDDCGSGCSGDDPVCCPVCESGSCGQICCTSSGSCF